MSFEIIRNNIADMNVDVIVNTVSPSPDIGSGVDSAIHKKRENSCSKPVVVSGRSL